MAGYSSNPLGKKLGFKPGLMVHVHEAPANYRSELRLDDPKSVTWLKEPAEGVQLIHAFTRSQTELRKLLALYRKRVALDGAIWISWPKKAAKVETDITEDRVRAAARLGGHQGLRRGRCVVGLEARRAQRAAVNLHPACGRQQRAAPQVAWITRNHGTHRTHGIGWKVETCHPERSEGSISANACAPHSGFFASLRTEPKATSAMTRLLTIT